MYYCGYYTLDGLHTDGSGWTRCARVTYDSALRVRSDGIAPRGWLR